MRRRSRILLPLAYGVAAGAAHPTVSADLSSEAQPTCESIIAERTAIETQVAAGGQRAAKRRPGLTRLLRGAAGYAAPSLMGQFGGQSQAGAIAAQVIGQGALQALDRPHAPAPGAPGDNATATQQERLDHLSRLAASRRCAG